MPKTYNGKGADYRDADHERKRMRKAAAARVVATAGDVTVAPVLAQDLAPIGPPRYDSENLLSQLPQRKRRGGPNTLRTHYSNVEQV